MCVYYTKMSENEKTKKQSCYFALCAVKENSKIVFLKNGRCDIL